MISKTHPVFIVGHPKSGTSLVTALLDSHPELLVLPEESDFYSAVWPFAARLKLGWRMSKAERVEHLVSKITNGSHLRNFFRGKVATDISGNLDYLDFDAQTFRLLLGRKLELLSNLTRKDCLLAIVSAFHESLNQEEARKKFWIEKTPKHLLFLDQITHDFPKAKFVFLYRDPRDNFVSYHKKHGVKLNALAFAKSWNNSFENLSTISQDVVLMLKYEDLVKNPTEEMRRVSDFLEIDWDPLLLRPTKLGKQWFGNSMFGESMKAVSIDSLERYKRSIGKEDLVTLEAFCQERMKLYGYKLEYDEALLIREESEKRKMYKSVRAIYPEGSLLPRALGLMKLLLVGKSGRLA